MPRARENWRGSSVRKCHRSWPLRSMLGTVFAGLAATGFQAGAPVWSARRRRTAGAALGIQVCGRWDAKRWIRGRPAFPGDRAAVAAALLVNLRERSVVTIDPDAT